MKVSHLVSKRYKESPADTQIQSQILMMRGGYIRPVGNGIYSLFPMAKRIVSKIEGIIREEMNRIDGQEVLMPVAMPASLWRESGRFDSVGSELLRFKDRNGTDMVLGMTHEEASVQLVRDAIESYAQFPFMIYQIQTKFRDEPRARGGLIRVREFTMKDGYSFHRTQEDLAAYYMRCHGAYERIYSRVGVPQVISVQSDSGMMGGKVAHEFMLLTDIGEDTLALCNACDFRSNMESAECIVENASAEQADIQKVATPAMQTIEEVSAFLGTTKERTCKAVLYEENDSGNTVIVFLRGDLDVNETKLRNLIKTEIHPAELSADTKLVAGFIGPIGLPEGFRVVFDRSLVGTANLVTGANEKDFHLTGFCPERDVKDASFHDVAKTYEGAICPVCGKHAIHIERGIEVGNIFQLGSRYSELLNMQYLDEQGEQQVPVMGCYGIGVGRLMASICEVNRDAYGPIWPISIAPYQVQICALRADNEAVRETADALYDALQEKGIEVLYDDRAVSAGVMFSDADLFGIPVRVVISPKGLAAGTIEIADRQKTMQEKVAASDALGAVLAMVDTLRAAMGGN